MFWPGILHMPRKLLYLYDQCCESSTSSLSLFCNCWETLATKTTTLWASYILVAWFSSQRQFVFLVAHSLKREREVLMLFGHQWTVLLYVQQKEEKLNTTSLHQNSFTANKCILHVKYWSISKCLYTEDGVNDT